MLAGRRGGAALSGSEPVAVCLPACLPLCLPLCLSHRLRDFQLYCTTGDSLPPKLRSEFLCFTWMRRSEAVGDEQGAAEAEEGERVAAAPAAAQPPAAARAVAADLADQRQQPQLLRFATHQAGAPPSGGLLVFMQLCRGKAAAHAVLLRLGMLAMDRRVLLQWQQQQQALRSRLPVPGAQPRRGGAAVPESKTGGAAAPSLPNAMEGGSSHYLVLYIYLNTSMQTRSLYMALVFRFS